MLEETRGSAGTVVGDCFFEIFAGLAVLHAGCVNAARVRLVVARVVGGIPKSRMRYLVSRSVGGQKGDGVWRFCSMLVSTGVSFGQQACEPSQHMDIYSMHLQLQLKTCHQEHARPQASGAIAAACARASESLPPTPASLVEARKRQHGLVNEEADLKPNGSAKGSGNAHAIQCTSSHGWKKAQSHGNLG